MRLRYLFLIATLAAFAAIFLEAQGGITGEITKGDLPKIAIPDFKGKGAAQPLMKVFNDTLWNDIADAGALSLVTKSNYPLEVPQALTDFRPPTGTTRNGPWLTDWSQAPVSTNYLAMGAADANAAGLVVQGNLLNVGRGDLATARIFTNPYFGALTEQGARSVAHQYAADILKQLGVASLAGSKIYFVSNRTGNQEIWSMDFDGANQTQMTRNRSISFEPTVSADGSLVAYATNLNNGWQMRVVRTDTGRQQTFVNPVTSTLGTPEFSPDGKRLWFSMVIDNWTQIAAANVDGGQMQRVSRNKAIELSPKINPKTGKDVLFISTRGGKPQLYHMNIDGTGVEMISNGQGEVHNPAWSPDGTKVAFTWNRGYVAGDFNIFIMDLATKHVDQLTHENGTNENPTWAPDGLHIAYSNQKGRSTQIYTILANGTRVKQLTTQAPAQGEMNKQPVWAKGMN